VIARDWEAGVWQPSGWYGPIKRATDVVAAIVLLLVLSPVMIAIAVAIRLDSKGPALFRQRRAGRGASQFTIYKFRTMPIGTPDLASHLLAGHERQVTRVGRVLRRTSLDELPQLLNVLAGDMSLVGPRPALFNQSDLIAMRQQAHVDLLRPGVTGLAQVEGRDELDLEEKVSWDRRYLETCSLRTDLGIVARTFDALLSARGAN
jgi:O-antigen biosynthesis protein WbqP